MSKVISKCPGCGSGCLWFKPDGSVLCQVCMKKYTKEGNAMKQLKFIGVDGWDRPVYKDESGRLWKDVNLGSGTPYLHSVADNDFDGEPDMPLRGEYEIIKNGEATS